MNYVHVSANMYAGNKTPGKAFTALRGSGADSVGIAEGYRYIADLDKIVKYRMFVGRGSADSRRGSKDTPVLVSTRYPSLGDAAFKISEPSTPLKIAPERWGTVSTFHHSNGLRMAVINFHPHAAVDTLPITVDRVHKYAASIDRIQEIARFYAKAGFCLVLSGDWNWHEKQVAPWSPYRMVAALGLAVRSEGLDAIAWDPHCLSLHDWATIPESVTGADHPWLRAEFRRT